MLEVHSKPGQCDEEKQKYEKETCTNAVCALLQCHPTQGAARVRPSCKSTSIPSVEMTFQKVCTAAQYITDGRREKNSSALFFLVFLPHWSSFAPRKLISHISELYHLAPWQLIRKHFFYLCGKLPPCGPAWPEGHLGQAGQGALSHGSTFRWRCTQCRGGSGLNTVDQGWDSNF